MPIHHLTADGQSLRIEAAPERVYDLISDVTRMGDWSPECYRCEWTHGSQGPVSGARFKAWNRRGLLRWSNTPTVIVANPGVEFSFARRGTGAGEVMWRYSLESNGGATVVTESYEVVRRASPVVIWLTLKLMRISDRERDLHQAMRSTLEKIKSVAEAS